MQENDRRAIEASILAGGFRAPDEMASLAANQIGEGRRRAFEKQLAYEKKQVAAIKKFAAMGEDDRPDAVVFAILTDGFENASQQFNLNDVRQRIEHQTSKYNWAFRFLAANQDAVLTGHEMGLAADSCETLVATGAGIRHSSMKLSSMCCSVVRERARVSRRAKKVSKDQ